MPDDSALLLASLGGDDGASLANSGVTPGSYTNANITVNAKGQVTAAANGSGSGGTVTTVSVVTANGVSGSVANPTTTPAISLTLGAITPTSVNGNTISTGTGTLALSTFTLTAAGTASVSGTNTGDQTSVSGNAGTATTLQTARNINGVSFNGSADITVTAAAGTLTGATLNSTVTASSLTSVGTLANLTVTNPISGSVTGNAATATALQNARTINGTSFDGTANITVTAAAGTLTGATLASGVTASSLTSVGTLAGLTVTAAPTFSALTSGRIPYASTAGLIADSANLRWDNSNVRLGVGGAPANNLHVQRGTGGACLVLAENTGNGTGDYAGFHTGVNGSQDIAYLTSTAPGFSASGIFTANTTFCYSTQTIWLGSAGASGGVGFFTGGTATTNERATIDSAGNFVVGRVALATNATDGFLYIPTCAGTPTGTPTAKTGRVPMVYDTTNNKLYVNNSGWKGVTLS